MSVPERPGSEASPPSLLRRDFVALGAAAVAAGIAGSRRAWAQVPVTPPPPPRGKEKLIVRSSRPVNLETPLHELTTYHTPEQLFFVRNNADAAPVEAAGWSLRIEGAVERPLTLGLGDLRTLPAITQDALIECAGNGRSFHRPRASGIQWGLGAVGNQAWTGVRLADVLALARPRPAARHAAFDGADKPPAPQAPDFIRSVPLWKALAPHTMIALEMGAKPIPHLHGGPVRVIVPGFVGSASMKWIERIVLLPEEFDGFYMKSNYTAPRADDDEQVYSLQSLEVKSIIVSPADGARVGAGRLAVWGWAWAGEAELTGVAVSTDGGQSWTLAALGDRWDRYSWRRWEVGWEAKPGSHTVMARATDSFGRVQPASRAWNRLGYRWNVIQSVKVDVA